MSALPDGKTRILNVLNAKNNQNVTLDQLVIGTPMPNNTGTHLTDNTVVNVTPATPVTWTGLLPVYYNREALHDWASANAPAGMIASVTGIAKISDLLIVLNNTYNGGFTLDDFDEGDLPTGPYPANLVLTAKATSYLYTGSVMVTLANNLVPLAQIFPDTDLGDIPSGSTSGSGESSGTPPSSGSDGDSPSSF